MLKDITEWEDNLLNKGVVNTYKSQKEFEDSDIPLENGFSKSFLNGHRLQLRDVLHLNYKTFKCWNHLYYTNYLKGVQNPYLDLNNYDSEILRNFFIINLMDSTDERKSLPDYQWLLTKSVSNKSIKKHNGFTWIGNKRKFRYITPQPITSQYLLGKLSMEYPDSTTYEDIFNYGHIMVISMGYNVFLVAIDKSDLERTKRGNLYYNLSRVIYISI